MFGLNTINKINRRAAYTLRKKSPVKIKTVPQARGLLLHVSMLELRDWLRKSKIKYFHYSNMDKCGCLMSRHFNEINDTKDFYVRPGGDVAQQGKGIYAFAVYPFHDEFWRGLTVKRGWFRITRQQAISRLTQMIKEQTSCCEST